MTDDAQTEALRTALGRSAAYGVRGARGAPLSKPADGLRFVHDQIARAMLGRRLTFSVDGVPRLDCEAAGCRLLRFTALGASGATDAEGRFDDLSETDAIAEDLVALRAAIEACCDGADRITLRAAPLAGAADTGPSGVPPETLAHTFGLGAEQAAPVERILRFMTAAGDHVQAAAYLQDDLLYPLKGDDEEIGRLAQILEGALGDINTIPGGLSGPLSGAGMVCWAPPGAGEAHMLAAAFGDWTLFARVSPGAQPALAQLWYGQQAA